MDPWYQLNESTLDGISSFYTTLLVKRRLKKEHSFRMSLIHMRWFVPISQQFYIHLTLNIIIIILIIIKQYLKYASYICLEALTAVIQCT